VIDVGRQKLYYTDDAGRTGKLGELSTDGTGHRVLISVDGSKPRAVVIDVVNRFEIWQFSLLKVYSLHNLNDIFSSSATYGTETH